MSIKREHRKAWFWAWTILALVHAFNAIAHVVLEAGQWWGAVVSIAVCVAAFAMAYLHSIEYHHPERLG